MMLDMGFPVEIQTLTVGDSNETGTVGEDNVRMESAHIRVALQGQDVYRISLWSVTDVFLNLAVDISREGFDVLRREQQLVVGFEGFPSALKKLLTACTTERVTHAALLVVDNDSVSLHIVCKMEHKIVELLAISLNRLSGSDLQNAVQARFSELQSRLEVAEAKVVEFSSMVRSGKVPSLLSKAAQQHAHHKPSW